METAKIAALLAAAELGSISKAAENLGYTQSGVTHIVNSLEEEAGFPLLSAATAACGSRPRASASRRLCASWSRPRTGWSRSWP